MDTDYAQLVARLVGCWESGEDDTALRAALAQGPTSREGAARRLDALNAAIAGAVRRGDDAGRLAQRRLCELCAVFYDALGAPEYALVYRLQMARLDADAPPAPRARGAVALRVRVSSPDGTSRCEVRTEREVRLGRGTFVELVLDDPEASLLHAVIDVRALDAITLLDLHDAPRTKVGGRAVRKHILGVGEAVEIGGSRVELLGATLVH